MRTGAIIWAHDMARIFGTTEEALYELAQRRRLPCAVSTKSPRKMFVRKDEMEQWAQAIREEEAA
jgi:helix-turn-helix protein